MRTSIELPLPCILSGVITTLFWMFETHFDVNFAFGCPYIIMHLYVSHPFGCMAVYTLYLDVSQSFHAMALVKFSYQGLVYMLVIYVCMHSSSKACRLLTTSVHILPRVLEACAWSAVHTHAATLRLSMGLTTALLDGIGECSLWQFQACVIIQALVASTFMFYCARDMMLF